MHTYFIHLAYDGSGYRGWQRQKNAISVQETIEQKLEIICKKFIRIYGCGRTDTGVHASSFFAHFFMEDELTYDLTFRLNKHLPNGIVIFDVFPVPDEKNARFSATSRTYDYFIHGTLNPILDSYSSYYEWRNYNFKEMKNAVALLPSFTDFRALCKQPDAHNTTICNVTNSELFVDHELQRIRFTITANRFLRGMIRIITAYLLKIGEGEMTVTEFKKLIEESINEPIIKPAQPNGLYLSNVNYPFLKEELMKETPVPFSMVDLLKVGLGN